MNNQLPSLYVLLISREVNLHICRQLMLAGFPASRGGRLAFEEIKTGDLVTFLFEGELYDLYEVEKKIPLRLDLAEQTGPWPVRKGQYGKVYFPYRLFLKMVRFAPEPVSLLRPEIALFARSLFKITNFWKTHYQLPRDSLSLFRGMKTQAKTPPPSPYREASPWQLENPVYTVNTKTADRKNGPFPLDELLLQIRLKDFVRENNPFFEVTAESKKIEILREQPFRSGLADLVVKNGTEDVNVIEVKKGKVSEKNGFRQILRYMTDEPGVSQGALIGKDFTRQVTAASNNYERLKLFTYRAEGEKVPLDEIQMKLEPA